MVEKFPERLSILALARPSPSERMEVVSPAICSREVSRGGSSSKNKRSV